MKDFRNLTVWNKGHQLTLEAYKLTAKFPREEQYGLTSQIRRCCASIPASIADGCGRSGNPEFHRFLQIASGSATELDYHFLLSHDLGFLSDSDYRSLSHSLLELRRMLTPLIHKADDERARAG